MDELKKYLQQRAGELDQDEPGIGVWQNILQHTTVASKKTNVILLVTKWAAAACLIIMAGIGIWHLTSNGSNKAEQPAIAVKPVVLPVEQHPAETMVQENNNQDQPTIAGNLKSTPPKLSNTKINQQVEKAAARKVYGPDMSALDNIEKSFIQVIDLQRERVASTPMYAETPAYFNDFKIQINQMEKDEQVIKSDIAKRGMNDELLGQLINLYQQKLNILKQLQTEMNKTNNRYKKTRGPVDTTRTYFLNI